MFGHISAAFVGRDRARRAGYSGMLGAALGLAGSIVLRRFMPEATSAIMATITRNAGRRSVG